MRIRAHIHSIYIRHQRVCNMQMYIVLWLAENYIRDEVGKALAEALMSIISLQHLNLQASDSGKWRGRGTREGGSE